MDSSFVYPHHHSHHHPHRHPHHHHHFHSHHHPYHDSYYNPHHNHHHDPNHDSYYNPFHHHDIKLSKAPTYLLSSRSFQISLHWYFITITNMANISDDTNMKVPIALIVIDKANLHSRL